MTALEKDYDLSDEDRKIVASQIKDLDEKGFGEYEKNAKVLLNEKSKAFKLEQAEAAKKAAKPKADDKEDEMDDGDDEDDEDDNDSKKKSKKKQSKASADKVVADAIKDGEQKQDLPNAGKPEDKQDKMSKAFALDQFVIKI